MFLILTCAVVPAVGLFCCKKSRVLINKKVSLRQNEGPQLIKMVGVMGLCWFCVRGKKYPVSNTTASQECREKSKGPKKRVGVFVSTKDKQASQNGNFTGEGKLM